MRMAWLLEKAEAECQAWKSSGISSGVKTYVFLSPIYMGVKKLSECVKKWEPENNQKKLSRPWHCRG